MLDHLLRRPPAAIVRGRPHFVPGPPAGPRGVVAWIVEGRARVVGGHRRVTPTAIIELHATGVRRRPLRRRSIWLPALLGLAIGLLVWRRVKRDA